MQENGTNFQMDLRALISQKTQDAMNKKREQLPDEQQNAE
jgi:hypothetical protein